jgi:hypothetical protein
VVPSCIPCVCACVWPAANRASCGRAGEAAATASCRGSGAMCRWCHGARCGWASAPRWGCGGQCEPCRGPGPMKPRAPAHRARNCLSIVNPFSRHHDAALVAEVVARLQRIRRGVVARRRVSELRRACAMLARWCPGTTARRLPDTCILLLAHLMGVRAQGREPTVGR